MTISTEDLLNSILKSLDRTDLSKASERRIVIYYGKRKMN